MRYLTLSAVVTAAICTFGCAAPTDESSEPTGSTDSSISAWAPQYQARMRQAKRLLRNANAFYVPGDPTQALIGQALGEINQGIAFDNNNITANEDNQLDDAANVAVAQSLNDCQAAFPLNPAGHGDCLLDAAVAKLRAATTDKGGFRVRAMHTIQAAHDAS